MKRGRGELRLGGGGDIEGVLGWRRLAGPEAYPHRVGFNLMTLIEEFRDRASVLEGVHFRDTTGRLIELLKWLEQEPTTKKILEDLRHSTNLNRIFEFPENDPRPKTKTREEIAMVGLHLIEICRDQRTNLFEVCHRLDITPPYHTSSVQAYNDAGLNSYVIPFLGLVEKKLVQAAEAHSVVSIAEGRFTELLITDVGKLLPKTAANFERITGEFLRPENQVIWQNIGNSCRQLLIDFAAEVREVCDLELSPDIKDGDVKAALRHVLSKIGQPGRYRDTLEALAESGWNHTQSLLHRSATTKKEATRVFLWTGMVVSEFAQLVKSYNEG